MFKIVILYIERPGFYLAGNGGGEPHSELLIGRSWLQLFMNVI
jgi:hypothetical protein